MIDMTDFKVTSERVREKLWRKLIDHSIAGLESVEPEIRLQSLEALSSALERCPQKLADEVRAQLRGDEALLE